MDISKQEKIMVLDSTKDVAEKLGEVKTVLKSIGRL